MTTWSFRDRPAWIFRPTWPSRRSIAECTSSSVSSIIDASSAESRASTSRELFGCEDPGDGEPPRVEPRALAVVRKQLRVVAA